MFHKYLVLLRMKYVEMFAYQLATIVWMTGSMIQPLITMLVWINIYESQADSFILYFALLIFVERMTSAWDIWELDREIREGTFSYHIIRPIHHIHWAVAENIIYKLLFLVILAPAWIIAAIWLPALRIHSSWWQLIMFISALFLGACVRFTYSYMMGLLGFWFTKVTAIYGMLEAVSLFLSGRIAPLSLMPPVIKQMSIYMPFRYMIGFPIEILTGNVQPSDVGYGFMLSAGWALLFAVTLRQLWKSGLKNNQAVGG